MGRNRARSAVSTVLLVAGVLVATVACGGPSGQATRGARVMPGSATSSRSPAPSTTATFSVPCAMPDLTRCLMTVPAGSRPWRPQYAPNGPLTVDQYLTHFYRPADRAIMTGRLGSEGAGPIVHQDWMTGNGDEADVVLIRFATPTGAETALLGHKSALAADSGEQALSLPGVGPSVVVYYRPKPDNQGFTRAYAYERVGPVVMELFFFSLDRFDRQTLTDWLHRQLTALSSIPS